MRLRSMILADTTGREEIRDKANPYWKRPFFVIHYFIMGPGRLERPNYCLEGSCSIKLSYDPIHNFGTR